MYRNARELDLELVPEKMPHRDADIEMVAKAFRPIADGREASPVRIFGPSGAGKTTIAQFTIRRLQRNGVAVRYGLADCMSDSSPAALLHRLCDELGPTTEFRRGSTPAPAYLDRLRDMDSPVVAILDEVHHVDDTGVLKQLHDLPDVSLIVIGHDEEELGKRTSEKTASRLRTGPKVRLDKYTHDEMVDILETRVKAAVHPRYVDANALDLIADTTAGNAREAIAILRKAVRHVQYNDPERVTPEVVAEIEKDARMELLRYNLSRLDREHRILFEVLLEADEELDGSTLHDRFEDEIGSSTAPKTRRRYLNDLQNYKLVEKHGSGRGATYSPSDLVAEPPTPSF